MINIELDEEMDQPCPCQKCGEWFDLEDGCRSEKWFPRTVICPKCGEEEDKEMERDEEINELWDNLEDARFTVKESEEELRKLGIDPSKKREDEL